MRSYCLTDVGKKRNMNQDFVYASDEQVGNLPNLLIVADGMGGHNAGEYASRYAVEAMVDSISSSQEKEPVRLLSEAVNAANQTVVEHSQAEKAMEGMGTTLVAATVIDDCLYVVNIGDSRLYVLDDRMWQITRDHSLVEEMVRAGEITREQARTHPEKNVITQAIGIRRKLKADFFDVALNPGDVILLCSDGLTNMIEDDQILQIVRQAASLEAAAQELVDTANQNGGTDNISVILAKPDWKEV